MKKIILFISALAIITVFSACEKDFVEEPIDNMELKSAKPDKTKGFDAWGYNWNAHHFNGVLFNAIVGDNLYNGAFFGDWQPYLGDDEAYLGQYPIAEILPFWVFRNVDLVMHWNESLISREGVYPVSLDNWIDTDAWITFHYSGVDKNGKRWSQFQKMVSRELTDYTDKENWYNEQDEKIGVYNSWDQLIMIQVVNTGNVPSELGFFAPYKSPENQGLGTNK